MNAQAKRNLMVLSVANAVPRFGDQYQFIALATLTYGMTGSALIRYDVRRVIAAVNLAQAVLTRGFLFVHDIPGILAMTFVVSSVGVFLMPARAALLSQMVGNEHLLAANARLAGAVRLLAPGLASTLSVFTGAGAAFLFDNVSFLFPVAAMFSLRLVEPVRVIAQPSKGRTRRVPGRMAGPMCRPSSKGSRGLMLAIAAYEA